MQKLLGTILKNKTNGVKQAGGVVVTQEAVAGVIAAAAVEAVVVVVVVAVKPFQARHSGSGR